jgi:2-C-methyl-D-erythritol 4-phosphate cytidylyltransferase
VLEKMATGSAAAVPGIAATDTVKLSRGGMSEVQTTLERRDVFMIQTPQAVRRDLFREAHQRAARESWTATDDVGLIEHYELGSVGIVAGEEMNFKITTPLDLDRARNLLQQDSSQVR